MLTNFININKIVTFPLFEVASGSEEIQGETVPWLVFAVENLKLWQQDWIKCLWQISTLQVSWWGFPPVTINKAATTNHLLLQQLKFHPQVPCKATPMQVFLGHIAPPGKFHLLEFHSLTSLLFSLYFFQTCHSFILGPFLCSTILISLSATTTWTFVSRIFKVCP